MQNDFWTKARSIRRLLSEPLYAQSIRDRGYTIDGSTEADLSGGCETDIRDAEMARELEHSVERFRQFLSEAMQAPNTRRGYRIIISRGAPASCPADSAEAFEISVRSGQCQIIAPNGGSARRALNFLEDEMSSRRAPALALGTQCRWTNVADRITRSPFAAYRFNTGWELLDEHDYYPEEYLNKLARCGVNGVWAAGLLRTLVRSRVLPELGPENHRLDKLKALVEKTARYGIKVHLFCMEPRSVRAKHPVFHTHPELRGATVDADEVCLCTSAPVVQEYLREAICELFTAVPDLGGLITIFNGERITNCWLSEEYARTCPRCSQRKQVDVLAEDLACFAEGIRMAGSRAKCMAWTYWMNPDNELETNPIAPVLELIEKTDKDIVWLGNFEHGGTKKLCGRDVAIDEYSLSFTGPSEPFVQVARACAENACRVNAKLQIGTAFELSSVPYVPVPGIVFDKFHAMKNLGVTGAMLNWIPGGFPSLMLKAAGLAAFASGTKEQFLNDLARTCWPAECADDVVRAWNCFEKGFQEYPFNNRFFYFGPIVRAPAYPLRLQRNPNHAYPLNWGIDRHRNPQPFEEDLQRWLGPFTAAEIVEQLKRMIGHWNEGLRYLAAAGKKHSSNESERQIAVASAVVGHFRCTRNVFDFLMHRSRLLTVPDSEKATIIVRMREIVQTQILAAGEFKDYIQKDPSIGYQSEILDFSYDPLLLDEAIAVNQETLLLLNGPERLIVEELNKTTAAILVDKSVTDLNVYGD